MPSLVDFHCHLDLFPDPKREIARAERARVRTLTVTTTPKAWPRNKAMTKGSAYVRPALGLHPQLVAERGSEVSLWERLLPEARYVGEVGLDGSPGFANSWESQSKVFDRILGACAESGAKILTVHSVRAAGPVLDAIERSGVLATCSIVLHWFTGTPTEARRAADMGCWFSINARMGRKRTAASLFAAFPRDALLTETDAPFVQSGNDVVTPEGVSSAVEVIASRFGLETPDARRLVHDNLEALVKRYADGSS